MAIQLTIHLSHHRDQLLKNIASHVADMKVALSALNSGSFTQQATATSPTGFHVVYTGVDFESGAQRRQIQKCFHSVVGSFITYLDELLGILDFASQPLPIDTTITEAEIVAYAQAKIDERISQIASNASLKNPQKVASFPGVSQWTSDVALGMFFLRNCFEHHGGTATRLIRIPYRRMAFTTGARDIQIGDILQPGEALMPTVKDEVVEFEKGAKPELTEQQLRGMVFSVEQHVSVEILEIASGELSRILGQ